jgi:hypothetical protein
MARREVKREEVLRTCHQSKTMQRFSVDQVNSIYTPFLVSETEALEIRGKVRI